MDIDKTEDRTSYFNNHIELVRKDNVKLIIVCTVPMCLMIGSIILAIVAPMVGIPLFFFGFLSFIAAPILVNYIPIFWKMFNEDNRALFKELRKNGVSFSRILDLFACSNATSINSEMLKILAESKLDLVDIQSSMETKEQVDAINSIDAEKRDMLFNNSRFNSDNKLYITKLLNNSKVINLINSMRAETLKALLDDKNVDCNYFIRLLKSILSVSALSPVHAERLNMLLNSNRFKFCGFSRLLDNTEALGAIGLINTEKWRILLNNNNLRNYELVKLLKNTKAVRAIESIAPEKWEMLLSNNNSMISVYLTKLLEDEERMEEINSTSIERFALLLNGRNSYTIHLYLMRLKSLQYVTFDQLSLISANFIAAENGHCLRFQIDKEVKHMDKEKFLVLIKSNLPNIFDPSCNSPCISLLSSRRFICGINSLKSAEELQSLIDKFSNDPDGFNNFHSCIRQRYYHNFTQNQSKLDLSDENSVRNILSKRPDVSKWVVDNSSPDKSAKILNNIKGNIRLANKIFDYKLLSDDDVVNLYTNENFDAKKINRNFRFALTLCNAKRDDGQNTYLQQLGIEQLITEPKSYSTQHYQPSLE